MLYDPRILYLDEPTVGLDVLAKERIRAFIQDINGSGRTTVILTTHDLSDVERLCRRVLLIDQGRLLYDGSIDGLKAQYAPHRVLVLHRATERTPVEVEGADVIRAEGTKVWLRFDPERVAVASLIAQVAARYEVTDLSIEEPELEGVVRQIYERRPELP
jgi:ABC-2 type transport system ATP-binding protein